MPAITSHPAVALELLHHAWRWCNVRCQSTAPATDIEMVSCCVRQHVILQLPPCARLLGCKFIIGLDAYPQCPPRNCSRWAEAQDRFDLVKLLLGGAPSLTVCARHSPHTAFSCATVMSFGRVRKISAGTDYRSRSSVFSWFSTTGPPSVRTASATALAPALLLLAAALLVAVGQFHRGCRYQCGHQH